MYFLLSSFSINLGPAWERNRWVRNFVHSHIHGLLSLPRGRKEAKCDFSLESLIMLGSWRYCTFLKVNVPLRVGKAGSVIKFLPHMQEDRICVLRTHVKPGIEAFLYNIKVQTPRWEMEARESPEVHRSSWPDSYTVNSKGLSQHGGKRRGTHSPLA